MKFIINKSLMLSLGLLLVTQATFALDQKVQEAAVAIATHMQGIAAELKDQKLIEHAKSVFDSAKKGDLQIPKPARAPKPDEQKSIDGAIKVYEKALVDYAAALKASNANKADVGLKSKADLAQGALGGAETALTNMIAAIK